MNKTARQQRTPTAKGIHLQLKDIVSEQLEQLPELLGQMEAKERVKVVLALLPYVAPRVETCHAQFGEPLEIDL